MTLQAAQAELLAAYQALEHAQRQSHAVAQYVRDCELRKVAAEAMVFLLTEKPEASHG